MKDHNIFEPSHPDLSMPTGTGATAIQANKGLTIKPFKPEYQLAIENLVLPIQQHEFAVGITREEQPDLLNISQTFQSNNGNFWVAIVDDLVVGCIGLVDIGDSQAALKKMFVHKDFRGKQSGVSRMLIQTAKHWCITNGIKTIFLGTVSQMIAAQRFYANNGFREVTVPQLPSNFPLVHVDTKFYRCDLD
ncbi:MAG: GNAT family N-acetyltransferase [Candidatus Obscuribacterales bacterium]|nr:GNAT family N-acetyltransferase [Candidatus Obscuribacterales bacterium]